MSSPQMSVPHCDFVVGENDVMVLVAGKHRREWLRGTVVRLLEPQPDKSVPVNMVVYVEAIDQFVTTHSSQVRKAGPPALWAQDELEGGRGG